MANKNDDVIEVVGIVTKCLPNTKFIVELTDKNFSKGLSVECYLAGKMRMHYIKIITGDAVTVELSPYDMARGRITYRHSKTSDGQIIQRNTDDSRA